MKTTISETNNKRHKTKNAKMTFKSHYFIIKKSQIRSGMTNNILDFSNREALLHANSALIAQLRDRLKAKRFRPADGDSIKIGYIRALIQALQAQNSILKDAELDDLKKEIEELKELMKCKSRE